MFRTREVTDFITQICNLRYLASPRRFCPGYPVSAGEGTHLSFVTLETF